MTVSIQLACLTPRVLSQGSTRRRLALRFALACIFATQAHAQTPTAAQLMSMSLEQQLDVKIVGASKYEQTQAEVAAAVSVITRQEIKAFGWRTLGEALASLPGVYTTYDRQYSYLGTRGFGLPGDLTARVLITIDGNRVNDPVYDGGSIGREFPVDVDLIERIEFIPGPGGAVYGQNAMFAVVNVITRTGAGVHGTELALATQHPQGLREGRATWGKLLDNGVDVLVSASGLRARGENLFFDFGKSGVSGVAVGQDGERDQRFLARIVGGPLTFEFNHGDRHKDDPTASFGGDPLVPGEYARDATTLMQLQYRDSFAHDTLQWTGRLFMGRYRFSSVVNYGTPVSFPAEGDWRGLELRLLSTGVAGHRLMLGLEAQDIVRVNQAALDLANPANNMEIAAPGYRIGVYAQDEWRMADTLTATLGLRTDRNDATGTATSPRAALIWQATPATTVKALYGRAHRAPNSYERDYGDGLALIANPALKGETVDTMEWVVDHRVSHDLALRGSVYQWTTRDLITLGIDPVSGLSQYQSGEEVKVQGLELSADKTWALGARLRSSLSLQNGVYASGAALPNAPKLLGKINLSGPLPWVGLRAGYELRYDSERMSVDGSKLGGYALSNLNLSTEALAKGLEVSLGIYNLFDKRYAQPAADTNWQNAIQQDGRSLRAQIIYKF